MGDESQIRQDVKRDSSRILYEDERYMIGASGRETDAHNLLVNGAYAFLGRGILNELARSDVRRLRSSLEMVGKGVLDEMIKNKIPLEELGWALAKATIRDQEDLEKLMVAYYESRA